MEEFRRPHQLHFKGAVQSLDLSKYLPEIGFCKVNRVWIVAMKTLAVKRKLLVAVELQIRVKRRSIFDRVMPNYD